MRLPIIFCMAEYAAGRFSFATFRSRLPSRNLARHEKSR
jgi:hypothetical protein